MSREDRPHITRMADQTHAPLRTGAQPEQESTP